MEKDDDDADETQGKTRFPVLPSLIALQQMRNRMATAQSGRRLMKWSALATGAELRRYAKELGNVYTQFSAEVAEAFISLARGRYFYPNLNMMVLENHPQKACVTVGKNFKSIAGCRIATYEIEDNCPDSYPLLGIDQGGGAIADAKKTWHDLVRKMIWINQLRTNFLSLEKSHDAANKKEKVLGKIIIPRTIVTIRYILSELEELEREEFFRLKKVLEVKYRHKKKAKAEQENKGLTDCETPEKAPPPQAAPAPPPRAAPAPPPRAAPAPPAPTTIATCIVCGGPMQANVLKPMTAEEAKKHHAAVEDIKVNLDKVLAATDQYEKTSAQKDLKLKDFKYTTEELKSKLKARKPPASIPDGVDVTKLCALCKQMLKEQHAKCVACGGPIEGLGDRKQADAKVSRKRLQDQLQVVLSTIQKYESQGLEADKLNEFKRSATELKQKLQGPQIPKGVSLDKLCPDCKERMQESGQNTPKKSPSKSKVSIKTPETNEPAAPPKPPPPPAAKPPETSKSPTPSKTATPTSSVGSSNLPLGVFETEEITEVIQVKNPDGSVTEKRRVINIKRRPPTDSDSQSTSQDRDKKVGLVSVIIDRKVVTRRVPGDSQSEYLIKPLPMTDRMAKACISSYREFGYVEALEKISELDFKRTSYSSENMSDSLNEDSNGFLTPRSRKDEKNVDDSSSDSETPEN